MANSQACLATYKYDKAHAPDQHYNKQNVLDSQMQKERDLHLGMTRKIVEAFGEEGRDLSLRL